MDELAQEPTEREGRLLPTLEALIDLQKRLLTSIASFTDRFDRVDTDVSKLTRLETKTQLELASMRSEISSLRSDVVARFDAVGIRFDELEQRGDVNTVEIRAARSEVVAQQNEILNVLQAGLSNMADVNEVRDRVHELEKRIAR